MSNADIDRMWCRALAEEIGDRPDLIERITKNYNGQRDNTLTARHMRHYQSCGCLGDSGECCVPSCECHKGPES